MIAASNPRRSGLPLFTLDPSRMDAIAHRRDALVSAGRWTTAVLVWIGIQISGLAVWALSGILAHFGWSDFYVTGGWLKTLPEIVCGLVVSVLACVLVWRAPRVGLTVAHYGSLFALAAIALNWERFVRIQDGGNRVVDGTALIGFAVLAALSGVALWKTILAKGAFGPMRENERDDRG